MKFELNPFHRNTPENELLDDLRRVAAELSVQSLTQEQYDERGVFCAATFKKRFGKWSDALCVAGLRPSKRMNIKAEELIADIRRVSEIYGTKRLTKAQYKAHGKFSETVVYRCFGSWPKALSALGVEPGWGPISTEELFENLEAVWRHLGRQPTVDEMIPPLSKYSGHTYANRFGGYRKALQEFVASIERPSTSSQLKPRPVSTEDQTIMFASQSRGVPSRTIGWRLRFLTLRRDGFRCRACGRSPAVTAGVELVVDHVLAWSNGGKTALENLQTLCIECNGGKSNLHWEQSSGS